METRPQHTVPMEEPLRAYYRERAPTYDAFYGMPELSDDLAELKVWLVEKARGRTILEVAAGTGYWTEIAAASAKAITATDCNAEALAIAKERGLGPRVVLRTADAFAIPELGRKFDTGMAHLWWSHVERQKRHAFLSHFASRLQPGAILLMIDQLYSRASSPPVWRRDRWGNRYELRRIGEEVAYEVVKNYPKPEDVKRSIAAHCDDIGILKLRHFWALRARFRRGGRGC